MEGGRSLDPLILFVDRVRFRWSGGGAMLVTASVLSNNLPWLQPHLIVIFACSGELVGVVSHRSSKSVELGYQGDVGEAAVATSLWFMVLRPLRRCSGVRSCTIWRSMRATCIGVSPRFGIAFGQRAVGWCRVNGGWQAHPVLSSTRSSGGY